MKIIDGLEEIDIVPRYECKNCTQHVYFAGSVSALSFLRHFATSDLVVDNFRRFLIRERGHGAIRDFHSDEKVLARIGQMVAARELHVTRTLLEFRMAQPRSSQGTASPGPQPSAPPAPPIAAGPPPPPPDEPVFAPNVDAAAVAQSLTQAAQSGVPFCEE